jgi:hypothetical protein
MNYRARGEVEGGHGGSVSLNADRRGYVNHICTLFTSINAQLAPPGGHSENCFRVATHQSASLTATRQITFYR